MGIEAQALALDVSNVGLMESKYSSFSLVGDGLLDFNQGPLESHFPSRKIESFLAICWVYVL